jgi:hypothetical protein
MNNLQWLIAEEYLELDGSLGGCNPECKDFKILFSHYCKRISEEKEVEESFKRRKLLGFHFRNGNPHASFFAGQVWLDHPQKIAFRVRPRREVDHFEMVSHCLEVPIVAHYLLKNCMSLWAEEQPLPLKKADQSFPLLLIIAQYLNELAILCRRHLKRGFPRIEENLVGRCKGRVLIHRNIIRNSAKGRMDRLYCQFQTHSLNTLENQILRAALEQSLRFLRKQSRLDSLKSLWRWSNESQAHFSEVTLRRIHPADFQRVKYAGVMKAYQKPLVLARILLRALGSDPTNPPPDDAQILLPPHAIDMNELFERYCEVLLRKRFDDQVWAGYGMLDGKNFPVENGSNIRPDFFLKKKKWVLDAKNKYGSKKYFLREDIAQICLYVRHKGIRKKMKMAFDQEEPQRLVLMYPEPKPKSEFSYQAIEEFLENFEPHMNEKQNISPNFHEVYKVHVPVPRSSR